MSSSKHNINHVWGVVEATKVLKVKNNIYNLKSLTLTAEGGSILLYYYISIIQNIKILNIGGIKHDFGDDNINQNNYIHPSSPKLRKKIVGESHFFEGWDQYIFDSIKCL